ncbi:hypothetical protein [Azospirillum argentinense]
MHHAANSDGRPVDEKETWAPGKARGVIGKMFWNNILQRCKYLFRSVSDGVRAQSCHTPQRSVGRKRKWRGTSLPAMGGLCPDFVSKGVHGTRPHLNISLTMKPFA